tara:strand:+ start:318 stop:584 length:267 start_codon:yes stop_codon:yes gene_type:complete
VADAEEIQETIQSITQHNTIAITSVALSVSIIEKHVILNHNGGWPDSFSAKFRRSLDFVQDIEVGEVITEKHIKSIRSGFGLKSKIFI